MPTDRRLLRLQQLVLETVASTVQRDLDDPRVGLVTITRVKLARDLTMATVFWSCLDHGGPRRTAERGLSDALPVIQRAVARALSTRQSPRLSLRFDEGLEKASRVTELFHQLEQERRARGLPPPEPAAPPAGAEAPDPAALPEETEPAPDEEAEETGGVNSGPEDGDDDPESDGDED